MSRFSYIILRETDLVYRGERLKMVRVLSYKIIIFSREIFIKYYMKTTLTFPNRIIFNEKETTLCSVLLNIAAHVTGTRYGKLLMSGICIMLLWFLYKALVCDDAPAASYYAHVLSS